MMQDCQVTSFQALCTALQHPALTADPQTVCCLLQTCRSWRAAVQQAAAGTTVIDLRSLHSIAKLSQFAAWIPRHAGMLAEVSLTLPQTEDDGLSTQHYATAAEQIILLALQNVAAAAASAAAGSSGTPAAVPQLLRLQVFCTDFLSGAGLLAFLPAATLTKLSVKYMGGYPSANSPAISQALAGLTSLKELSLQHYYAEPIRLSGRCLQAVSQLSCLSALCIGWVAEDADLSLLPQQLQQLELMVVCGKQALQLQHLTGVRNLKLELRGAPAPHSSLPQHVALLTISTWGDEDTDELEDPTALWQQHNLQHLGLGSLRQLVRLQVINGLAEPQMLHRVACLPRLEQVLLCYSHSSLAARAAPAWQHLPQLKGIDIEGSTSAMLDRSETEEMMQYIGAATTLTSLRLASGVMLDYYPICQHLRGLQQLRELELSHAEGPSLQRDALNLTALTGLTQLVLAGATGVNDTCAVAIASWLRQLRHLELRSCGLVSAAALPAIGSLTQLRTLVLDGHAEAELEDEDILLLSSLTQLQAIGAHETFSDEAVEAFVHDLHIAQAAEAPPE
ncbi:hypothetical protein COO60DRAFT_1168827 [Scenedesmus sp. NREL 46B-D3]|nr:hypothetical protein COO60DRAFT_1168827 [Scenedesmus sp. NREL 46B-D3]